MHYCDLRCHDVKSHEDEGELLRRIRAENPKLPIAIRYARQYYGTDGQQLRRADRLSLPSYRHGQHSDTRRYRVLCHVAGKRSLCCAGATRQCFPMMRQAPTNRTAAAS